MGRSSMWWDGFVPVPLMAGQVLVGRGKKEDFWRKDGSNHDGLWGRHAANSSHGEVFHW